MYPRTCLDLRTLQMYGMYFDIKLEGVENMFLV